MLDSSSRLGISGREQSKKQAGEAHSAGRRTGRPCSGRCGLRGLDLLLRHPYLY